MDIINKDKGTANIKEATVVLTDRNCSQQFIFKVGETHDCNNENSAIGVINTSYLKKYVKATEHNTTIKFIMISRDPNGFVDKETDCGYFTYTVDEKIIKINIKVKPTWDCDTLKIEEA